MNFRIILIFLFFTFLNASTLEKINVQLNWNYQFEFAGFIAAKEKGLYKELGLDVSLMQFNNKDKLVDRLINKEYDFLVTNSDFLFHKKTEESLILLSSYFKQSPVALVSQKDIFSLYSLKNKRFPFYDHLLKKGSIPFMLEKLDINNSRIKYIKSKDRLKDFQNKKIDAMSVFVSDELYEFEKRAIKYNIFYPSNYGLNAPELNVISTKNFFNMRKNLVRKFIQATNEGWDYALKNKSEIIDIIYNKYSQVKSKEALAYEANIIEKLILEDIYPLGSINIDKFSTYFNYLKNEKKIAYDPASIIYIPKELQLTKKEKNWLLKTKKLEVLVSNKNAPYIFYDEEKKVYDGILVDYIKELRNILNIDFDFVLNREQKSLSFINILESPSISLLRKKDNYITTSSDFLKKRVITDNVLVFNSLKKDFKELDIILLKDYEKSLSLIKQNKKDFFLTNSISHKYWSKKQDSDSLKFEFNAEHNIPYFLEINSVLSNDAINVIKKAIKKIPRNKKDKIYRKWTLSDEKENFDYRFFYKILFFVLLAISVVFIWNINLKKVVNKKTKEVNELLKTLELKVEQRTQSLNKTKVDLENYIEKTLSSIKYASLIQNTIIPKSIELESAFDDSFVIWEPKDIVGGDIYLFETLKKDEEYLLIVIDCTGHGVSGALLTMLIKAIERQLINLIRNSKKELSPAKILEYFDKTLKEVLRQDKSLKSLEAGCDGGVLYYNKKENFIKYAGAKTPLYYVKNEEVHILKSTRRSIAYKTSQVKKEFEEYKIKIDSPMSFYLSTDGFIDQTGGEKGFCFGKNRFIDLLKANYEKEAFWQKNTLQKSLSEYQKDFSQDDDITVIGLKLNYDYKNSVTYNI